MTGKSVGLLFGLAVGTFAGGCSTMGHKQVKDTLNNQKTAQAKPPEKFKDDSPKGFVRGIIDSGYISNTKSPSDYLFP